MSNEDLNKLSKSELFELIAEHKAKLLSLRVAKGLNKEFKPHLIKQSRRAIARLMTQVNRGDK